MPKSVKEKPKRLQPKGDVLRRLYLHSGNICAYPACDRVMINRDGVMIGKICHIEAAEPGGKRFNAKMSNEQRRSYANLILLCGDHHTLIDSDAKKYSVQKLRRIKLDHEAKFSEIAKTLKRRFTNQFEDTTDGVATILPKTMASFMEFLPDAFGEGDMPDVIDQLTEYAGKLEKAPEKHREFMLAVYRRAEKMESDYFGQAVVDTEDLKGALDISDYKINKETKALERYGLGGLNDPEPGVYQVALSNPSDFLTLWDIASFCEKNGIDLRRFFIDVDLGFFD